MKSIHSKDSFHSKFKTLEKDFFRVTNEQGFLNNKKSTFVVEKRSVNVEEKPIPKNHDFIFDKILESKSSASVADQIIQVTSKIPFDLIKISKQVFLKLIKRVESHRINSIDLPLLKKQSIPQPKLPLLSLNFLDEQKAIAIKNLVNEKFDEVVSKKKESLDKITKITEKIQKLFQKEMLFEHSLTLLAEDEIDVNQLLYCAFEKIQSENYVAPSDQIRFLDGYFEYEDQLHMPVSRVWRDKNRASQFKIDLTEMVEEI